MSTRDLFAPRLNVKPYEYPEILNFRDAIREAYWLHTEFNFSPDVNDFHTNCSPYEREVIKRTMLAISQIEVAVKKYWGRIDDIFPKPEITAIASTFAESEDRHLDAYATLLERLGLNDEFKNIHLNEVLMKRVSYMESFMEGRSLSNQRQVASMVLFSMFVEHISLFSQFLIMMSFNKERNIFKGISNAVEATSKEEEIHGRFGIYMYHLLREEHPELFTEEFYSLLKEVSLTAYNVELEIVDWIYGEGDLDFLPKEVTKNYILDRYNTSISNLGLPLFLEVANKELLEKTKWFDMEVLVSKETDFFVKRSTDYTKRSKSFDDIF